MSEDAKVYRERALKDKSAILELRQNAAFQNYFMRRINQGIEQSTKSLKYDTLNKDEREIVRQRLLQYEEIQKWTSDTEIASCDRMSSGQ